ncbi:MAG: integrase family protein [Gammaproteobacteria bacterium]|jgi:integrase|nr:integrase family protein [Gammaproteobacteria bacterium]
MKVQKAIVEGSNQVKWLVIDNDYLPVKPIQQYFHFLESCDKSPCTLRTYAHHLKLYWEYLNQTNIGWDKVNIDIIGNFIVYLKGGTTGNVISIEVKESSRSGRTINQIITAIYSFYNYHGRSGNIDDLPLYFTKKPYPGSQNQYKPLLHHISKGKPVQNKLFKLKEKKSVVKTVEAAVVKKMVDACNNKRDKFLIALLYETGCRIGQALGLRHADIESYNNIIRIVPRNDNINQARAKTKDSNVIYVSKELMSLYCDYYLEEYGEVDSDYVFVNLWSGAVGTPITYTTVSALFKQLSVKVNCRVTPHMLRHTHATELLRDQWDLAYIQKRLGHKDIQTTMNTYIHLTEADMKKHYQAYLVRRKTR